MTFTEKEQKQVALMNVVTYKDFEDYTKHENLDREEFEEQKENGYIQDITLGTYNGALDKTDYRELDKLHILEAIGTAINEDSETRDMLEDVYKDLSTNGDYIRAYTEFFTVFTLEGHIYVNMD